MKYEMYRHSAEHEWTYEKLDKRQREIAEHLCNDPNAEGVVLLSEVAPVITMGRKAAPEDLFYSNDFYANKGIQIYHTDRGGKVTWHGQGQWVLFIIEKLERLVGDPIGVRKTTLFLLDVALRVGRKYKLGCEIRSKEETGAWCSEGKFAALGIKISKGVLLHGVCINGYRAGLSFFGLRPCGLNAPVAFLLDDAVNNEVININDKFITLGQEVLRVVEEKVKNSLI
ncbi:MAG: hypothetical protein HY843_02620 [Bdellovibrio sp.]|nr:hypothetical protein [Bdellovibrio sp.]